MNNWVGIIIILGIIFIGMYGGATNPNGGMLKIGPIFQFASTTVQNPNSVEITSDVVNVGQTNSQTTSSSQTQTDPTRSKYADLVYISNISRYGDVNSEYVQIQTRGNASTTVPITGWRLKSESSGQEVTMPKATYLYFAGSVNSEENVILSGNETVYLITGYSPNGASFKLNKCSGYLSQFQNWNPYLPYSCPAPKNEDTSAIPKTLNNDACFDYIDYMPSCRIQTDPLPQNWSYECTNFIYTKVNYPYCINTHKNDRDFWLGDWRIYLKRSGKLWKDKRESVILIDNEGKIVSRYTY